MERDGRPDDAEHDGDAELRLCVAEDDLDNILGDAQHEDRASTRTRSTSTSWPLWTTTQVT